MRVSTDQLPCPPVQAVPDVCRPAAVVVVGWISMVMPVEWHRVMHACYSLRLEEGCAHQPVPAGSWSCLTSEVQQPWLGYSNSKDKKVWHEFALVHCTEYAFCMLRTLLLSARCR